MEDASCMKRVLAILLLLLSALAFLAAYLEGEATQRSRIENAATAVGQLFVIPSDSQLADPDQMYAALLDSAAKTQANIFRTRVGFTLDGRSELIQYALLTGKTHLVDAFALKSGRWLTPRDTQSTAYFLSTVTTRDPAQVGTLRDFGGNHLVSIRPLKMAFASLPVAGEYVVESTGLASSQRFLEVLADRVTQGDPSSKQWTAADFGTSATAGGGLQRGFAAVLTGVSYLVVFLTTILLVYFALSEAKRIGVMKLHGLRTLRVWYMLAGRFIVITMLIATLLSLVVAMLVTDTSDRFVVGVAMSLARTFAIMLVASLATCAYIARVKVSDSVKNRKDTLGAFLFNALVKAGCSILLIVVGVGLWTQSGAIARKQATLANWASTQDYGVFYPVSAGYDAAELKTGLPGPKTAEVFELYPVLNRMGSLYIDALSYEPTALAQTTDPQSIRSITVNPNYLRAFPLRDAVGRPVDVPEDTSDWVVLVPLKYRDRQAETLAYFQRSRTGGQGSEAVFQAEEALFKRAAPPHLIHQKVRIIWTANDQRVFSFNPLVFPSEGNIISDPIIQVMTSTNSLGIDRANMASGGGGDDPLKVRLVNADPARTLTLLSPTLKSLKLADNLNYLITVNDFVLRQISDLQQGMKWIALAGIALGIGLLVLVAEHLAIVFDAYARKIVVRRLFGLGFVRTYREFLLLFSVTWALQITAALLANGLGVRIISFPDSPIVADSSIVLLASMAVILTELPFSLAALALIEKRNLVQVLKGVF
jgi:bacteriocin-associated integral membrane protein